MESVKQEINVVELLMQIREDVSSIKTDMVNFKNNSKAESETTSKQLEKMEQRMEKLEEKVEKLEDSEDKKDAKKWRTVFAFIATAIGGMILSRLPQFINYLIMVSTMNTK